MIVSLRVVLSVMLVFVLGGGCRLVAEYAWASPPDGAQDGAVGRGDGAFLDATLGRDARGDALDLIATADDDGAVDVIAVLDDGAAADDGDAAGDGDVVDGGGVVNSDGGKASDSVTMDLSPDLPRGAWMQVKIWEYKDCNKLCGAVGRQSVPGPEGATCVSGEARPASAIAAGLVFHHGCWTGGAVGSSCAIATPSAIVKGAKVVNNIYCYYPGQTKDGDLTDRTIGCFCRSP